MLDHPAHDQPGAAPMPLRAAADLQDKLMAVSRDLDRLQTLTLHA